MQKYPDVEKMTEIFNDLYKRFSIINKIENINFKDYINDIWNSFRRKKKDDQQHSATVDSNLSQLINKNHELKDEIKQDVASISHEPPKN